MTIEFQVEGMSCQHCVAAVTNAIREHDGRPLSGLGRWSRRSPCNRPRRLRL